jgi:copper transport protein
VTGRAGRSVRRPGAVIRGGAFAVGLALTVIVLEAPAAAAHAFLVDSTPVDGETLLQAPAEIRLRFTESVALDAMVVDIVDSHGRQFRPIAVEPAADPDAGDAEAVEDTEEPMEVVLTLPPLAPDAYRVAWRTLSSDDLHRTSGVLAFGIGRQVAPAGMAETMPDAAEVVLRLGIFLALAIAMGGLSAGRLLAGTESPPALISRCRRWSACAAFGGVTLATALLTYQLLDGAGGSGRLLTSAFGGYSALRIGGFALLGAAALPGRQPEGRPRAAVPVVVPVAASLAVGLGTALIGHSGAGGPSVTLVLAAAAHLLAGAAFAGTLLLTVVLVVPWLRRAGNAAVVPMLRTFGRPAAVCVAVLVVSGLYLSSGVVVSVDAALLTFYGRILIVKIVVVALVAALGLANHSRLRRYRRTALPLRSIRAEASLLAGVLVLAAVLTSTQPARGPQFVRPAAEADGGPVRDVVTGDIHQVVSVAPNTPGRNVIAIDAVNTRRPALAPIRSVVVELVGTAGAGVRTLETRRLGTGQWAAGTDIPWSSAFTIRITVGRAGLADVTTDIRWALATGTGQPRRVVVSDAPIGGPAASRGDQPGRSADGGRGAAAARVPHPNHARASRRNRPSGSKARQASRIRACRCRGRPARYYAAGPTPRVKGSQNSSKPASWACPVMAPSTTSRRPPGGAGARSRPESCRPPLARRRHRVRAAVPPTRRWPTSSSRRRRSPTCTRPRSHSVG